MTRKIVVKINDKISEEFNLIQDIEFQTFILQETTSTTSVKITIIST